MRAGIERRPTHKPESTVSRRADFIWLLNGEKSSVTVRSSRLVFDRPQRSPDGRVLWQSDHHGVLADLHILPADRAQVPSQ